VNERHPACAGWTLTNAAIKIAHSFRLPPLMPIRSLRGLVRTALAIGAGCVALLVHAAPAPDPSFGTGGRVRLGVPTGFEEITYVSTIQADGKVIVAGTSNGRETDTFVTRFTTAGVPDPSFAGTGTLLVKQFAGFQTPLQIEALPDGTLWLVSTLGDRVVATPIDANGNWLDLFSSTGAAYQYPDAGAVRGAIRLVAQPDGKQLYVSDASENGSFALRLKRFQPTPPFPYGTPDSTFGPNGERVLGGLPPNFTFTSTRLAVAEPDGGFTLIGNGTFVGSTWVMLRVTGDGAIDPTFGGGDGLISGFDSGNPRDIPTQLARAADGGYVVFGIPVDVDGNPMPNRWIAWKLDAQGHRVAGFGSGGTVNLPEVAQLVGSSLPDGSIAIAGRTEMGALVVARYSSSGQAAGGFGASGVANVPVAGYLAFNPVGVHGDAEGRVNVAGWGFMRTFGGITQVFSGRDALVAGLSAAGQPRADFGRGDGIAVWNQPAASNDRPDAIRVDAQGRIVIAGFSDATGIFDYLLTRLTPGGSVDTSYGTNGRLSPNQVARFVGPARAALGPDGALTVASGEALGSFGTVRDTTMFRATASGVLDPSFNPAPLPAGPNAAVALGVRADGRIVYGTIDGSAAVLQQFLPSGAADPSFGSEGKVSFPIGENPIVQGDLVVLPDGSVAFAVFLDQSIRIFKVDAQGVPVAAFGTNGQLVQATPRLQESFANGPTLLALADGSLLAAQRVAVSDPTPDSPAVNGLYVLRVSAANGQVLRAEQVLAVPGYATFALAALPDASVLIALNFDGGGTPRAYLHRMLPTGSFDASFGVATGYALSMTQVTGMTVDTAGRLLVSGQDATSAVVARYVLTTDVASAPVVEFFNTQLGHYFVTAGPGEIAGIDTGTAGPGWQRTSLGFRAYIPEIGIALGALPVCRFYGTPGKGPNSHFYTANAAECAAVKSDVGWTYEGIAFWIGVPSGGACASGTVPVYRSYNNRFAQNDSNHRYTTDPRVHIAMVAVGWVDEGVVMCAPAE